VHDMNLTRNTLPTKPVRRSFHVHFFGFRMSEIFFLGAPVENRQFPPDKYQ
jgi:hypothetical protein